MLMSASAAPTYLSSRATRGAPCAPSPPPLRVITFAGCVPHVANPLTRFPIRSLEIKMGRMDRVYRPGVGFTPSDARHTSRPANQIAPNSSAACGPVKLSPPPRATRPQDTIKGAVVINGRGHSLTHEGISLHAEGQVSLQLSAKSVGLFEAFYSSIRPVQLLDFASELQGPSKLP